MRDKFAIEADKNAGTYETRSNLLMPEEDISLWVLVKSIWNWRWFISAFTITCTALAVFITLFILPVMYTSTAFLQPSNSGKGPLLSSLGLAAEYLQIGSISQGDQNQVMLNYLASRELKIWMIKQYNLLQRFNEKIWDEEKKSWLVGPDQQPTITKMIQTKVLNSIYTINKEDGSGLIKISYTDKDPVFAARIVGGVIEKLNSYLSKEHITDAKRSRIFVEDQLKNAEKQLEYWEKQLPSRALTANQILRELTAATMVYKELKKQFELAKIEEEKGLVSFKILDPPLIPELKSSPERGKICALAMLTSFFVALSLVVSFNAFLNLISNKTDQ